MDETALRQKYLATPQPLREWFNSEEFIDKSEAIDKQCGIPEEKIAVIPRLLLRLQIKDLALENFQTELAKQLGVPPAQAEKIFDEVKLQLLMPIARDLAAYGIGTKEFAVIAAATASQPPLPRPGMVSRAMPAGSPLPPFARSGAALPPFFTSSPSSASSVSASPTPAPAPAPFRAPTAPRPMEAIQRPTTVSGETPQPFFLHEESSTTPTPMAPKFSFPFEMGKNANQIANAGSGAVLAPPPRPARVELGMSLPRYDGAPAATMSTKKETPLPRNFNYIPPPTPGSFTIGSISATGEISFGGGANDNANAGQPERSQPLPPPEQLQVPLGASDSRNADVVAAQPTGVIDRLVQKIAPWHYARFSQGGVKASSVLAETPADAKVVNYGDAAPQPMPAPQSIPTPQQTPVPQPHATNDLPIPPPKPLA